VWRTLEEVTGGRLKKIAAPRVRVRRLGDDRVEREVRGAARLAIGC